MRKILLLLIATIGLVSFKEKNADRNAYIIKAIEERVKGVGMDIKDVKIKRIKNISEKEYAQCEIEGGMECIAGKVTFSFVNKEQMLKEEQAFEEKLSRMSDEKGYGYFVRVVGHMEGDGHPPGKRSLQVVVNEHGKTELAWRHRKWDIR